MNSQLIEIDKFKIHTREDRSKADQDVINEVIVHDCYRLKSIASSINPSVVLDVGGHIGTFGILAKYYWPNAKLIALEPNKISYELYKLNMQANNATNYIILNRAISYNPDATCLTDGKTATGGGHIRTRKQVEEILKRDSRYILFDDKVEIVTVEDLFKEYNIEKVDFAKWDCEGGEIDAFKNMNDETAKKFGHMAGEYHISGGAPAFISLVNKKFSNLKVIPRQGENHTSPIELFWITPKDVK